MVYYGTTRIVFKIGSYAIKIPNFKNGHLLFLSGCLSNWKERNFCIEFKDMSEYMEKVSPSLFCTSFGLLQVQKYCEPLNRELTEEELNYFDDIRNGESKDVNFGLLNGKVVCLDYQ